MSACAMHKYCMYGWVCRCAGMQTQRRKGLSNRMHVAVLAYPLHEFRLKEGNSWRSAGDVDKNL